MCDHKCQQQCNYQQAAAGAERPERSAQGRASNTLAVKAAAKTAALQWAYHNGTAGEFTYYIHTQYHYNTEKSGNLAQSIVLSFKTGQGRVLPAATLVECREPSAAQQTGFHDALSTQICGLTGVVPRIAPFGTGFAIYYE